MTGAQRPWLWSLPTRVELAEDAVPVFVGWRENLPGVTEASRSAWRTGVLDVAGRATDVTRILRRRPGAESGPSSAHAVERPAEGGDGGDGAC